MTNLSMTQCPACTNVTLTDCCANEPQSVFPCQWKRCSDPKCAAVFDLPRRRGHRLAPERPLRDEKGVKVVPRVRMNLDQNGDWRDHPADGV